MTTRIAVVMTCHDRIERTLACLATVEGQVGLDNVDVDAVVVDAGSTDGTADEIENRFPSATVLRRGDDLYWNGGMREAVAYAYASDPDLYLWLNDDVTLDADAIGRLVAVHESLLARRPSPCIVVGSTRDPHTGGTTYGGVVRSDLRRPLHYELVEPIDLRRVETMNGNCVLVPREVVARIGTLARTYTHGMGDYDYGHRACRAGCEVWVVPGTIGTCSRNPARPRAQTLAEHKRRVTGPTTGLPRGEWFTFARRWAGPLWPVYAVSPYLRRYTRWVRERWSGKDSD